MLDAGGLSYISSSCQPLLWITIYRTLDFVGISTRHLFRNEKLSVLKWTESQDIDLTTLWIEHMTFIYSAWCSPDKDTEERGLNTWPSYTQFHALPIKIHMQQNCGSIWAHIETTGRDCYFEIFLEQWGNGYKRNGSNSSVIS